MSYRIKVASIFFLKKPNRRPHVHFFEIDSIEDIYFYIVDCVAVYILNIKLTR